jgi:hypothetical protein
MGNSKIAFRGVWLAIIVLTAVIVSAVAGVVFYAIGTPLPTVIGAAGAVFVGVVSIGMNVWKFLTE